MSITTVPAPLLTITETIVTDDKNNNILNEEISSKLSTIIKQNNEAFNQEEKAE